MKYAITYKTNNSIGTAPLMVYYGIVRPFDTPGYALRHARKIFGSMFESMRVRIVEYSDAVTWMKFIVMVNSGRLRQPAPGKPFVIDEGKKSFDRLYPSLLAGYKSHLALRAGRKALLARGRELNAEMVAKAKAEGHSVNSVKGGHEQDRELRLAMYGETGTYVKPCQEITRAKEAFDGIEFE